MTRRAQVSPRIVRRRSKIVGWGVFAAERIPKNKRIIDYAGELITHRESGAAVEVCAVLIGTTP